MMKQFLLAAAALCSLAACQTTIPQTDTTPPVITMMVQGTSGQCIQSSPGGGHETDCGRKYPKGSTVTFECSVKDAGGVKMAYIAFPGVFTVSDVLTSPNSTLNIQNTGSSTLVTATGDRNHPVDQIVITGKVQLPTFAARPFLYMIAEDFGGQSGPPNHVEFEYGVINVAF